MSDDPLSPPTIKIQFPDGHTETIDAKIPQEEEISFWAAVGYSVNAWAHIDRGLFECCHLLLGTTEKIAAIVFYSLSTSSQRKQLVEELMEATVLPKEVHSEWDALTATMRRLTKLRNILAHQPVLSEVSVKNTSNAEAPHAYEIQRRMKVMIEPKEALRGRRKSETFSFEEMQTYVAEVTDLRRALMTFVTSLKAAKPPYPESSSQEAGAT